MDFLAQGVLVTTVILGGIATMISISLCTFFCRSQKSLGKAMALMLGGEAVMNGVVTTFAALQVWGDLPHLDPMVATALRWSALILAIVSSCHLSYRINRISE